MPRFRHCRIQQGEPCLLGSPEDRVRYRNSASRSRYRRLRYPSTSGFWKSQDLSRGGSQGASITVGCSPIRSIAPATGSTGSAAFGSNSSTLFRTSCNGRTACGPDSYPRSRIHQALHHPPIPAADPGSTQPRLPSVDEAGSAEAVVVPGRMVAGRDGCRSEDGRSLSDCHAPGPG